MSDNKEIIYVGKGKKGQYGIKISVCLDDMFAYAKNNIEKSKNGKKYIRLDVNEMRSADEFNNTHTVKVDTWKPEAKTEKPAVSEDDCPFN